MFQMGDPGDKSLAMVVFLYSNRLRSTSLERVCARCGAATSGDLWRPQTEQLSNGQTNRPGPAHCGRKHGDLTGSFLLGSVREITAP